MIYVYEPRNMQWHGFPGDYNDYSTWTTAQNWCKETGNLVHIRDQQYIDCMFKGIDPSEANIEYHSSEETLHTENKTSTIRQKGFKKRESIYNEQLHPPYIQLRVVKGDGSRKYIAFDNYGGHIASANILDDLDYSVNRFFSIN